jgi:hypothetical protein
MYKNTYKEIKIAITVIVILSLPMVDFVYSVIKVTIAVLAITYDHPNDMCSDKVTLQSQAGFIVTLADYMYKSGLVADQEINMVAFLTEVMIECEYT